ncbi:MAG: carboxylesterase/lipase family protein [Clostridiaceae bacterium]|nr:carboxylesterase/lipase family protein [Clostridiaceae bacterium]
MKEKYDPELVAKARTNTIIGKRNVNGVIEFKGIPFAEPPVGRNRWKPAQPLPESNEVLEAYEYRAAPVQPPLMSADFPTSEDCLYLNIWTKSLKQKNKPVLVWVYGGSYVSGSGSDKLYSGESLVAEQPDILLVTFNYRLGVFGSLNLSMIDPKDEFKYSCNLSILDTQAALRWIHENIEAFGGDPDNITLFGQSAGSNNITANLQCPNSRRYFKRFIGQSSFAFDMGLTPLENSLKVAEQFFTAVGTQDLELLLALPANKLLEAQMKFYSSAAMSIDTKLFSPVLDGLTLHEGEIDRIAKGSAAGISCIIGTNSGEYDMAYRELDDVSILARITAENKEKLAMFPGFIDKVIANDPDRPLKEACLDIKNDLDMRVAGLVILEALSEHSDTYSYYFNWRDPAMRDTRTPHGAEVAILFAHEHKQVPQDMARAMRLMWTNFARWGDPSTSFAPDWSQYKVPARHTLVIDEKPDIVCGIRTKDIEILYPIVKRRGT